MARFLGHAGDTSTITRESPRLISGTQLDEKILTRLGLNAPPADPKLLAAFLVADDAADAAFAADEFTRGVRRAVRLSLARSAGLHRQARQPWRVWVEAHFKVGYACYHRYHVAAMLQLGLLTRGLPPLTNEHQSRSIAPFRRHEKFWDTLAAFKNDLPPAAELKGHLRQALGVEARAATTARIKLHRVLHRVLTAAPAREDDPTVIEAVALVRRAIAVLENGAEAA